MSKNEFYFSAPESTETEAGTVKLNDEHAVYATFSIAEAVRLRNQLEEAIDAARKAQPEPEVEEDGGYLVEWAIDIEGDEAATPEQAAREAWDALTREGSIAHVFEVTGPRGKVLIDLDDLGL